MPLQKPAGKHKTPRHHQGFTLIEIIVVVLIIGIVVSFATLSVSGRSQQDRLNNEARRLAELMQLASDEAVLQSMELGLRSKNAGTAYEFLVLGEEGRWNPYELDGPLRERRLPSGINMSIVAEGFQPPASTKEQSDTSTTDSESQKEKEPDEEIRPSLLLLSSGEMTPFEIHLKAQGASKPWLIQGNLMGKITSTQAEEPERP
ncbi:MAG: type II secretion system minor pseudopilin GspH [Nevskiales bacterium]